MLIELIQIITYIIINIIIYFIFIMNSIVAIIIIFKKGILKYVPVLKSETLFVMIRIPVLIIFLIIYDN